MFVLNFLVYLQPTMMAVLVLATLSTNIGNVSAILLQFIVHAHISDTICNMSASCEI